MSKQSDTWEEELREMISGVRMGERDDVCIYNLIRFLIQKEREEGYRVGETANDMWWRANKSPEKTRTDTITEILGIVEMEIKDLSFILKQTVIQREEKLVTIYEASINKLSDLKEKLSQLIKKQ